MKQKRGKPSKVLLGVIMIQILLLPLATAQSIEDSVRSVNLDGRENVNGLFGRVTTIDNESLASKEEKVNLFGFAIPLGVLIGIFLAGCQPPGDISCDDDCSFQGQTTCVLGPINGSKTCGDYDDDTCLEWKVPATLCEGGCEEGDCIVPSPPEDATAPIIDVYPEQGIGIGEQDLKNIPQLTKAQIDDLANLRTQLKSEREKLTFYESNYKTAAKSAQPAIAEQITNRNMIIEDKESSLNDFLTQNGIPEELNERLDAIDEKATTWTANYNEIFLKDDDYKKEISSGVKIEGSEIINRLNEHQTNPLIGNVVLSTGGELPDFFDWRNVSGQNYITPIKNQGNCGSCWAFGADATFEGHIQAYYNNPGIMPDLAEQDLVSCAVPYPSDDAGGCSGAYAYQIEGIFQSYWKDIGNTIEPCIPYTASDSPCSKCADWQQYAWKDLSYKRIHLTDNIQDNINNIKIAVVENGPIEVAMYVYNDLVSYRGGIYQHTNNLVVGGHAVTIVGFGKHDGRDYYIVKNSWGTGWGENGYFKIFADDSYISEWFAFAVTEPNPPAPQSVICTDNDADGYCYWGLGSKPTDSGLCPASCLAQSEKDCDDSDGAIFQNCGMSTEQIGALSITSTPSNSEVYIADKATGNWVYRGRTPLTFNLGVGIRSVKVANYLGYFDKMASVNIEENKDTSLNLILDRDSNILAGWPKELNGYLFFPPVIEDLDNDGKRELITVSTESDDNYQSIYNTIHVFNYDGSYFKNFSLTNKDIFKGAKAVTLSAGDINNDGKKEIIAGTISYYNNINEASLSAIDIDKNLLWSKKLNGGDETRYSCTTLADINNDGYLETIVSSGPSNDVSALDKNGNILWSFNAIGFLNDNMDLKNCFSVGYVNDDGEKEIVFIVLQRQNGSPDNKLKLYILSSQGKELFHLDWAFGDSTGYYKGYRPILADTNNDGKNEIYFVLNKFENLNQPNQTSVSTLYSVSSLTGPAEFGVEEREIPDIIFANLFLSDINNDQKIEFIILGTDYSKQKRIIAYDNTFNEIFNKVVASRYYQTMDACSIGDINNDSFPEIIFQISSTVYSPQAGYQLKVMDHNGNILENYARTIYNNAGMASPSFYEPFIDSLNGNIVIGTHVSLFKNPYSNLIYLWGFNSPYNPQKMPWPMFQHDPQHTGCYGCVPPLTLTVTSPNGGESWINGSTHTITWTSRGAIADVDIYLSRRDTIQLITPNTPNDGSYDWTIPANLTNDRDYKIMIMKQGDNESSDYSDYSNNYFSIVGTCSDSDGGIDYYVKGIVTNNVEFYEDNCLLQVPAAAPYYWTYQEVNECSGERCLLQERYCTSSGKVSNGAYNCPTGCSNGTCPLPTLPPAPAYATASTSGTKVTINWSAVPEAASYHFIIYTDGIGGTAFDVNAPATSAPAPVRSGHTYFFDVFAVNANGTSPPTRTNSVTVLNRSTITATSPNGGESWAKGSTHAITWNSTGNITDVGIYLKKGSAVEAIVPETPNVGSYDWTIPTTLTEGSDYIIKIMDADDNTVYDYGGNYFTITPALPS